MKHRYPSILFGLLLGSVSPLGAQATQPASRNAPLTSVDRLQAKIKSTLLKARERFGFPGASLAYVLRNGESGSVAVGRSGPKDPLKANHTLFSGSIGKTYFSAVAMQLVSEKKLELDTKISKYLSKEKWFSRLPNAQEITVRQLMNHTSGIAEHVQSREFAKALTKTPTKHWQPAELLAFALDKPALFDAGKGWSYADTNYIVLGTILESITGQKAYDLVHERLLKPLALHHTYPTDHADIKDLANGLTAGGILGLTPGWLVKDGKYRVNPQFEWCGGGYASTTLDLAHWCKQLYSGKVIPKDVRADLLTGVPARLGPNIKYGLGVMISPTAQGLTYGHSGFMPGYISVMAYYVEHDIALALQFNTDNGRKIGQQPRRYLDKLVPMLAEFQESNTKTRQEAKQKAEKPAPQQKVKRTPVQATTKIDAATQIDKQIGAYHKLALFNGSLLVADKDKVILAKGYGFANFEWKIHNTADTRFRIGSITKQFTSMLIMQLVQAGKIAVDKPITTYLDYYRKDTGDKVTVHQLLRHTSGIPSCTSHPDFRKKVAGKSHEVKDFVQRYCSGDLEFEPGSRFRYNNSGYYLLGAIIESVTGKKYEQVLQDKILDPAGMKHSGYDHHSTILERRASGYDRLLQTYRNAPYLDMSNPYAAGSLYSTVEDLERWDVALRSGKLLAPKLARQMFTPGLRNYAYGWGVRAGTKDQPELHRHSGGINGFNSLIVRVPAQQRCIVLLSNAGRAPLGPMAKDITQILNGNTPAAPKLPPLDSLAQVILDKGPMAALSHYRITRGRTRPATSEQAINDLGYRMLGLGQWANAILVFRFNVAAYPGSANTHDSLGEAYMLSGQNNLAIASYRQALELDPKSETAKQALEKLGDGK